MIYSFWQFFFKYPRIIIHDIPDFRLKNKVAILVAFQNIKSENIFIFFRKIIFPVHVSRPNFCNSFKKRKKKNEMAREKPSKD